MSHADVLRANRRNLGSVPIACGKGNKRTDYQEKKDIDGTAFTTSHFTSLLPLNKMTTDTAACWRVRFATEPIHVNRFIMSATPFIRFLCPTAYAGVTKTNTGWGPKTRGAPPPLRHLAGLSHHRLCQKRLRDNRLLSNEMTCHARHEHTLELRDCQACRSGATQGQGVKNEWQGRAGQDFRRQVRALNRRASSFSEFQTIQVPFHARAILHQTIADGAVFLNPCYAAQHCIYYGYRDRHFCLADFR